MEWLKNMRLKQSFFFLTFICLLASLLFAAVVWAVCTAVGSTFPSGGIAIDSSGAITLLAQPTPAQSRILSLLGGLQIASCILFPVIGLGAAGTIFYHWKLKRPIAVLMDGTKRVQQHDLDFSIPEMSEDELGKVCMAFEAMRVALLKTNQELWRQMEERQRLNAAFSHDLRNPITVLKGTVKLLRCGGPNEQCMDRLERYTVRIEQYVEAMSSIQRLEQMPIRAALVPLSALHSELAETVRLLAPAQVAHIRCPDSGAVLVDHGIVLTVAENLIGNAARFARRTIQITLSQSDTYLSLTVSDDGAGYPAQLVKSGPKPFSQLDGDSAHFGMGLYSSMTLCSKHGGDLMLRNSSGAVASATFQLIQDP